MIRKITQISIVLASILFCTSAISACNLLQNLTPTSIPYPTYTPNPTYTPYPTYTPMGSPIPTPMMIESPSITVSEISLYGIEVPQGYKIEHLVKPPLVSPSDVEIGPDDGIYVTEWFGNRVLKVDQNGTVSTYLELEMPFGGFLINSVGDLITFQGEELVRISPMGERSVITTIRHPGSWDVGPNDDLFLIVGGELIRFAPDGHKSIIATGLQASGEMAISPSGDIFVADWPRGRILRIDLDGNVSTLSSGFVFDAFNISFDNRGNLYQNQFYFTQVSLDDGSLSSPFLTEFNVVLVSRPFAFDSSGDAIFVGPTTNNLFRVSIEEGRISVLVRGPGNSYGLAVGPSGDLVLGASNEYPVEVGRVVRISPDGAINDYVTGFTTIKDILFDEEGNMYVTDVDYGGEGGGRIIKIARDGTATILFSGFYDLNNMVYDAANGSFLAFDNNSRQILSIKSNGEVTPIHYDFGGEIHTVELTPGIEGDLIALVIFEEGHDTGPVHRGLFKISNNQQVTFLTDIDTPLATTEDDVFVHPSGDIFVVGPEEHPVFRMLRITPQGEVSEFARNLPYDTLSLTINNAGDIFFTCSAGLFKISEVE